MDFKSEYTEFVATDLFTVLVFSSCKESIVLNFLNLLYYVWKISLNFAIEKKKHFVPW